MMGMGNEAKIGVGVILGLFVILCVVLAVRLSGGKAKDMAAVAAADSADSAGTDARAGNLAAPRLLSPSRPTIISASGSSTTVLKAPLNAGGWSLAADSSTLGGNSSATSATTPPSLMPNPQASAVTTATLTLAESAAPTTFPAAATETVANATPATSASNITVSVPPAPSLPSPPASPATMSSSPAASPAATAPNISSDPYQRSGSSVGTSNSWGSVPPPSAVGSSSASLSAGDPNATTSSYSSASAYPSSPGAASGGMSTYRQSRYGYGSPPDPISSAPPAPMGSSTIPDATSMSGSAMAANPVPSPGRRNDGTYKVRPNDNYWTICENLYGTGAYFKALAEVNRDRTSRDDHLRVGTVLQAPAADELEKNYPDLCPKANHRRAAGAVRTVSVSTMQGMGRRVYTVEQGDTLIDIASRQLGKKSRWAEIYDLNRDKLGEDHDYLPVGMQLAMPESSVTPGGRGDSLADRPGPSFRR
jgi:nucleoid-associated protein YgaU